MTTERKVKATKILLHADLSLYLKLCGGTHLSICSPGLWCSWRFWGWRRLLFSLLFLRNIWEIRAREVCHHLRCRLASHWLLKILRRPCRIRISGVTNWCCCEIRVCLEFIHPTGCSARRAIPTNVSHMFNICRIPNFHLSFLHNKDLGNEFETFVDPFHLGNHDGVD